jgi:hypothetical protein
MFVNSNGIAYFYNSSGMAVQEYGYARYSPIIATGHGYSDD